MDSYFRILRIAKLVDTFRIDNCYAGAGAGHKSAEGEDLNVLEQGNSDVAGSTAAKEGYQEHFPPAPSGAVATVPSTPSDGGHDGGVGGAGAGGVGDREVEGRQGEA